MQQQFFPSCLLRAKLMFRLAMVLRVVNAEESGVAVRKRAARQAVTKAFGEGAIAEGEIHAAYLDNTHQVCNKDVRVRAAASGHAG